MVVWKQEKVFQFKVPSRQIKYLLNRLWVESRVFIRDKDFFIMIGIWLECFMTDINISYSITSIVCKTIIHVVIKYEQLFG